MSNIFVDVGLDADGINNIAYSLDNAQTWSKVAAFTGLGGQDVVFDNNRFVAVGEGTDDIYYSDDGILWIPAGNVFTSIIYGVAGNGNGTWVATGNNSGGNNIAYSIDNAVSWSKVSAFATEGNSVTFDNNRFVVCGDSTGNNVYYSDDGITWSPSSVFSTGEAVSVAYGNTNNTWVVVGTGGGNSIARSTNNAVTWANVGNFGTGRYVTFQNNRFVVCTNGAVGGNDIVYSDNSTIWTSVNVFTNSANKVTYGNGVWVAVGQDTGNNSIAYSNTNAATWTKITAFRIVGNDVIYANNRFVATGSDTTASNNVYYSDDGISWSPADAFGPVSGFGRALAFASFPVPCFVGDTFILTEDGEKKIKDITSDDYIIDKWFNKYKVANVFSRDVNTELVLIKANAITEGVPTIDTICTPSHRIEIGRVNQIVEAQDIINESVIKYKVDKCIKVYHILLENDEWRWMIANGMLAETLDPNDIISRAFRK